MPEIVGGIAYEVTLETGSMVDGQRKVKRELDATSSSLNGFSSKLSGVASAISVLAVAMAALKSAQMADDMRLLGAKVEVAAGSIESGAAAMAALEAISKRTSTSVAANAEVFTRLNQALLQMGGTQQDTLQVTETLSKAIRVSGANAVEAKMAMVQFGQAMGSGKLQGDELRSMMESTPYLMRKMAEGIGVPVGALKKLGEEGKLTSDVVANALSKAADSIDADFQKFPQTIASAMAVAMDAAERANTKFDELSGTSTALTGVTKGLGVVLDELAKQFGAANDQAGILGKNTAIATWSDKTKLALSYVADAADVAWQAISVLGRNVAFVFAGVGAEIGGIGAQVSAVMRGDFAGAKAIGDAMTADSASRRAALDAADAKTLAKAKTAGQQMREAWETGVGGGRGFVNPQAASSNIKPPSGATGSGNGKTKKSADEKFSDARYLATLKKQTVDTWDAITAAETEAVRKSDALLAEKKISVQTHEESLILIARGAAKDRQDLMAKETQDSLSELSAKFEKEQALKEKAMQYGAGLSRAINPVDALRQEYEAKLELVTQYEQMMALAGVNATEQGQLARTQITNEHELQRMALAEQTFRSQGEAQAFLIDSINALSSTATSSIMGLLNGTMSAQDAMRALAGTVMNEAVSALVQIGIQQIKNALLGDTLAAADKAKKAATGAVYAASVGAQVAGMSALAAQNAFAATAAIPIIGPGLAPAAAAAAGAMAAGLGAPAVATAPLAGARQYGGPVSSGGLYRVNETGAPEMFTGSNGQQYLMPTKSGSVTAADKIGGGKQAWTINVQNAPAGTTTSVDDQTRTVTIAVAEVASQIRANSGPVWSAMRSSSNVAGRM